MRKETGRPKRPGSDVTARNFGREQAARSERIKQRPSRGDQEMKDDKGKHEHEPKPKDKPKPGDPQPTDPQPADESDDGKGEVDRPTR